MHLWQKRQSQRQLICGVSALVDAWGPGTRDKTLFILEAGLYHKNWHPSPTLQGADHQKQEEGGTHPMHTKKRQQNLLISTLALSGKGKKKHKTCPSKFHQRPESRQILDLDSHPPPPGWSERFIGMFKFKVDKLAETPRQLAEERFSGSMHDHPGLEEIPQIK